MLMAIQVERLVDHVEIEEVTAEVKYLTTILFRHSWQYHKLCRLTYYSRFINTLWALCKGSDSSREDIFSF